MNENIAPVIDQFTAPLEAMRKAKCLACDLHFYVDRVWDRECALLQCLSIMDKVQPSDEFARLRERLLRIGELRRSMEAGSLVLEFDRALEKFYQSIA